MQLVRIISRIFSFLGFFSARRNKSRSNEECLEISSDLLEKQLSAGWQQGTLLSLESSRALRGSNLQNNEYLIIATQTCDLLHRSLTLEPTVELLTAEIVNEPVPKSAGKSFRWYELTLDGDKERHLYIKARPRVEIERQQLFQQGQKYDLQLDSHSRSWFSRWLGERYTRPAFPNAFDHKLASQKSRIAKTLKSLDSCRGMYLTLSSWQELENHEIYSVAVLLLMRHNATHDEQQAAEKALAKICSLMTKAGHDVDDTLTRVTLEDDISLHDFLRFRKWSLDYISLRNPNHEEPPTVR